MSDFTFNYKGMAEEYNTFKKVVSSGELSSVSGILTQADTDLREYCQCERAIYGDLANQLLLDWDNFSSDFPKFVEKFDSWARIVAAIGGKYEEVDAEVKRLHEAHQLGWAAPTGMTEGYVKSGYYSNAYSLEDIKNMEDLLKFYNLTGAKYVDTGMVAFGEKYKTYNKVTDILAIGGILAAPAAGLIMGPCISILSPTLGGLIQVASSTPVFAPLIYTGLGLTGVSLASSGSSSIAAAIGYEYDIETYMKNSGAYLNWNPPVKVDGKEYTYFADTTGGTQLYKDSKGRLYYLENDKPVAVKISNGSDAHTYDLGKKNYELVVGKEKVNGDNPLSIVYHGNNQNDSKELADFISGDGRVRITGEANFNNNDGYIDEKYTMGDISLTPDSEAPASPDKKITGENEEQSETVAEEGRKHGGSGGSFDVEDETDSNEFGGAGRSFGDEEETKGSTFSGGGAGRSF